jgi:dihydrofolate reductase
MRKLIAFSNVTLDGYFVGATGDMSWAHKQDEEWRAFTAENARGGGGLVFGRTTYEMMARYWPTPQAAQNLPAVAEGMNRAPKVVFSRTLEHVSWQNTRLLKGDLATETRQLQREPGGPLAILGSGSIIAQLAEAGLIDEYHVVINPLALGQGRTIFAGLQHQLLLKLTSTRTFKNGCVLLRYEPAG